jgi:hypothetical protein
MRQQTEKAKEIQKLIEQGLEQFAIRKLGYEREIVRYYWRKIKNPKQYVRFIKQISGYNEALLTKKKKKCRTKKTARQIK